MELVKTEAARAEPRGGRPASFATAAAQPRNLLDSVRRRLLLVALLAIAPIAALGMIQGIMQLDAARDEARQRLLQHAVTAASTQANIIASAESVLETLKTVDDVREGRTDCQATLYGATLSLPFAANIGVLDRDGTVTCIALPGTQNVAGQSWWLKAKTSGAPFLLSDRLISPATRTEVIAALVPLRDKAGAFDGAVVMGLDVHWLDNVLKRETPPTEGIVAVFDARGHELVSNARDLSATLFAKGVAVEGDTATALKEVQDASGRGWTYAVAPLGRDDLVAAFALPTEDLYGWTPLAVAASFALPGVVVALSLVGLWFAVDRIVLQWLLYLRRVTTVYAQGHYGFRPTRFDAAPSEFRALGQAVENMALAVRLRDARLREALAEKTALVREIHHRIKNSLQVVVSLLSLYGSGISHPEDRRRFEQLRTRVNTLAVVHRLLYEASEGSAVRLRELLRELAALIEGVPDRDMAVRVHAPDVLLPTDLAVPFALMVVELVLSLSAPGIRKVVDLTADCEEGDGRLHLTVEAPLSPPDEGEKIRGELAHGFASQLGGQLVRTEADEKVHVTGDFPWPGRGRPQTRDQGTRA